MVPWIFVTSGRPLEYWMNDYPRIFDAWEEGGVRGIAVGYLRFRQEDGADIPTFPADPKVYEAFGVAPPPETPRDPDKEQRFYAMLDDAASRGWAVMIFSGRGGGGGRPLEEDPYGAVGYAADVQDVMNAYPQAQGVIIDGPGEHHYELAYHHGGEVFAIRAHWKQRWAHLGIDLARIERGIAHLRDRFHHLTPSRVRYHAPGGMLSALSLFDIDEDALYWLRTRRQTSLDYFAAIRKQIDRLNRKVKLGGIPRTPTFSPLTGQDYHEMAQYFDYIFPKHYFWHRGFDGMYGTIARWVQKIAAWNPSLTEADCFAVVKAWFGIELPGIHTLADMDMGFPEAFFSEVVYSETRRALEAVGDEDKVIAWVSSGRHPHAGDPMPARDLRHILAASERAGLKRFLYHPDPDLGAPEWGVISGLCGKRWQEDSAGYWPSDTPKSETFG